MNSTQTNVIRLKDSGELGTVLEKKQKGWYTVRMTVTQKIRKVRTGQFTFVPSEIISSKKVDLLIDITGDCDICMDEDQVAYKLSCCNSGCICEGCFKQLNKKPKIRVCCPWHYTMDLMNKVDKIKCKCPFCRNEKFKLKK